MEEKRIPLPKQGRRAMCTLPWLFGLPVISVSGNSVSDSSVHRWDTSFSFFFFKTKKTVYYNSVVLLLKNLQ